MPFIKVTSGKDKGKYRSPSGRIFTPAQMRLYRATGGTFAKARLKKARKKR